MTHDPYVGPPMERPPRGRMDGLRPWLAAGVVVLLLLAPWAIGLVNGRQDPSLQIPVDAFDGAPAGPEALVPTGPEPLVPTAPEQ